MQARAIGSRSLGAHAIGVDVGLNAFSAETGLVSGQQELFRQRPWDLRTAGEDELLIAQAKPVFDLVFER